jgi:hypothetical protein
MAILPVSPATAVLHTTPWPIVVAAYLDATTDSPHTRRAYQRHLQAAFTWLDVPCHFTPDTGSDAASGEAAQEVLWYRPGVHFHCPARPRPFVSRPVMG